jgi:CO/xanthine dehydrogenase Mo-binding subunit
VVATRLGNPMECKFLQSALVAVHASLLATVSGKPMWLQINAGEHCRYGFPGPGYRIRSQTALDRDGNLVGARLEFELDAGAYAPEPGSLLLPALRCSWGGYKIPNVEIQGSTIRSNRIPSGSFRAAGRAQAFFAAELNSSRLEEIGELDPYSWKSRNLFRSDRPPAGRNETEGAVQTFVPEVPKNVLDAVVGMSNFKRKHSAFAALKKRRRSALDSPFPLRGTGLAVAYQEREDPGVYLTRPHNCTIKAVLDMDKRLHLYTSFVDHGPGIHDLFARRAARLMEMDIDRITVEDVDTQAVPDTGASTLSRALSVGLPLVEQCCQAIKNKRLKSLLPIEVRRSCREPELPARSPDVPRMSSLAEAAWAAAVVEAEVDPVSLEVLVRGLWLALACGSCDDLPGAERYAVGEAIRALGWASLPEQTGMSDLTGRFVIEDGRQSDARTRQLQSAAGGPCASLWAPGSLPGGPQVPAVFVRFVDDPNTVLRGFEQLPYLTVPAAYAAAVSQATGLYIDRVPITPEVIQECLET